MLIGSSSQITHTTFLDTHNMLDIYTTLTETYITAKTTLHLTSLMVCCVMDACISAWMLNPGSNKSLSESHWVINNTKQVCVEVCVCVCGCRAAACTECRAGSSLWTEGPRATAPSPGVSAALSPNPSAHTSTWAQGCAHVSRQRPGHVFPPPKLIYQRQPQKRLSLTGR